MFRSATLDCCAFNTWRLINDHCPWLEMLQSWKGGLSTFLEPKVGLFCRLVFLSVIVALQVVVVRFRLQIAGFVFVLCNVCYVM